MNDLKFKILKVKKNPDVTYIEAKCLQDGELVRFYIPTLFITDRDFIKKALKHSYLRQTKIELEEGEII